MGDDPFQDFVPGQGSGLFLDVLGEGLYFLVDLAELFLEVGFVASHRREDLGFELIDVPFDG